MNIEYNYSNWFVIEYGTIQESKDSSQVNEKAKKIATINMDELDDTFTKKFTKIKSPIRSRLKGPSKSQNQFKKIDDNLTIIDNYLSRANKLYDLEQYAKAAELYESVIKINGNKNLLSKTSFESLLQDVYLCHFNLWKESHGDRKEQSLKMAYKSLSSVLTKVNNQKISNLFNDFAAILYKEAFKNITNENYDLAFHELYYLIKIDIKSLDKIDCDVNSLFDEILYNMTVCISSSDANGEMINKLLLLLVGNQSINKELKDKYLDWLENNYSLENDDESSSEQEVQFQQLISQTNLNRKRSEENLILPIKKRKL